MKKGKNGFVVFMLVVIVGIVVALYLIKDKDGVPYVDKILDQKEAAMQDVNDYVEKTNERSKEIEAQL